MTTTRSLFYFASVSVFFTALVAARHFTPGWQQGNVLRSTLQTAGLRFGPLSFDPSFIVQEVAPKLAAAEEKHPIIFIPPLTGEQLDVSATNQGDVAFFLCKHDFPRVRAWLNPWMLLPGWFSCWVDRLSLECDLPEGTPCRGPYGVSVAPRPGFASAMSVDPWGYVSVYSDLASSLQQLGWKQGVNLAAHLYDFRLSPLDFIAEGGSFSQLKTQIEDLVDATGKPVIAIGLSMAPMYMSLFLDSYVSEKWKAKHIQALISVSGFWGGAPVAPLSHVSGVWGGVEKFVNRDSFLQLTRHLPVLSWLTPAAHAFGATPIFYNTALNRNYTAREVGEVLQAAGAKQAAAIWSRVKGHHLVPAPNVTLYCFYGTQIKTPLSATYSTPDFHDAPLINYSDGDGTIPIESLRVCKDPSWTTSQASRVVVKEFPNFDHGGLIHSSEGFHAVLDAVADIHRQQSDHLDTL